jgi:hypothetical protein
MYVVGFLLFPQIDLMTVPAATSGGPTWGSQTSPTANNQGFDYNFNYNVELSGVSRLRVATGFD